MTEEKSTDERSMGRKTLDAAKYIGKNFWKVLPFGSLINYNDKHLNDPRGTSHQMGALHSLYALFGISALGLYALMGMNTGAWTPKQIRQYNFKKELDNTFRTMHEDIVNKKYRGIYEKENPKTFQDSLEIYQKYGLPIRLLEPTIKQKEDVVNKMELERKIK